MTHRSRLGWADAMDEEPPPPPAHAYRLPPFVRRALIGLVAAVMLLIVAVALMAVYVYQANQYVQGRGEFRDQETERLREEIRQGQCDLLDTFPEGVPALERARVKYRCGPGIPIGLLTPEEQARISARAPSRPAESPAAPAPVAPLGSAADPGAVRQAPNVPTAPREPVPTSPSPEPLVDLGPITGPVCDLAGVCV